MTDHVLAVDGGTPVRTDPQPPRGLIGEEEKAAAMKLFDEAIASGDAFGYGGPCEDAYTDAFVSFMGGGYADGVNSGTNALYCALGGLQLDALSEVIVPPITDPGGVMPVVLLGCVPVFADSAPGSFNTSAQQIEPLINERSRAIVVAHIAGEPVDMDPVMELAARHNLYVVEDCAQAHGATCRGKKVGAFGHIAAFSTMFGKHHCSGGQGGIVYSRDEQLHWQAKRFADRGKPFNLDATRNVTAGLNCNMDELSAAIGCVQLARLPEILAVRRKHARAVADALADLPALCLGRQEPDTESAYWFLRIRLDTSMLNVDKALFLEALGAEGIPLMPEYRHLQYLAPWFKNRSVFGSSGFPWSAADYAGPRRPAFSLDNALRAVDNHFVIKVHEGYSARDIEDLVAALLKVERAYRSRGRLPSADEVPR